MQRMQVSRPTDRWLLPAGIAMGCAITTAALIADRPWFGLFGLALLTAFGGYMAFSRSEFARIQGSTADERERNINLEAMQFSYSAVCLVAVAGFLYEIARGSAFGPFTLICAVGGFSHIGAVAYLKRRR